MFNSYHNRLGFVGNSQREAIQNQSRMTQEVLFDHSLSYKPVYIAGQEYDAHLYEDVKDNIRSGSGNYMIEFRQGITFPLGTYVDIRDNSDDLSRWLIMETVGDLFDVKYLIKKCNYELRWKNADGKVIRRWVAFDDSYKLDEGTRSYDNKSTLPEASIVLLLPYDKETREITFDDRFIIDDSNRRAIPDVYAVTNRSAMARHENGHGIIKLSLKHDQFNLDTDSQEYMIADYYNNMPEQKPAPILPGVDRAEIIYNGKNRVVMGTPAKEFKVVFFDTDDKELELEAVWDIPILPEFQEFIKYTIIGNTVQLWADYNENLFNYEVKLRVSDINNQITTELITKVVSGI